MKIYVAADHAGFALKEHLVAYMRETLGHVVEDMGAESFVPEDDYPEIIARAIVPLLRDGGDTRAIILGGSGQGEAMVANRFKGIRAAVYYGGNPSILALSREHNDANVLSLGARFLSNEEAEAAVSSWLATPFSNEERHMRRIMTIDQYPA
jgi:ribose 5-phosphate isomerase B